MTTATRPAEPGQAVLEAAPRRCTATMMLTDIADLIGIRQHLTEEQLWQFLREHYRLAGDAVIEHGGTIDKFMGDAMLALFNLPGPLPGHERQAVAAALALRANHADLCRQWQLDPERHQVQVGINTGDVLAGLMGHPSRNGFSVLGDAVNIAALLCRTPSGGFVLGQTTAAAVRDVVETDEQQTDRFGPIYVVRGPRP